MISLAKKISYGLLVLLLGLLFWSVYLYLELFHTTLINNAPSETIKVPPGSGVSQIARHLYQRGLLKHPDLFIFYARITGISSQIRYGEYWISAGMTPIELLKNLSTSNGMVLHKVVFVEGWTFADIKLALAAEKDLQHDTKDLSNAKIMQALGHPGQHPEGRFFPDTYQFTWRTSDLDILRQAYQKMQNFLNQQWPQRATGLPYKSPYQALIVASLIEKETALDNERPLIAGVILRRLNKRMRLQIDPTVLYGLGKPYSTPITKRDLQAKNPYNTYQRYGLPPTPIDNPSGASIIAALHPAMNNRYLFYVARGDGSHQFSETYRQHLKAVRELRNAREVGQVREKLQQQSTHAVPTLRNVPMLAAMQRSH